MYAKIHPGKLGLSGGILWGLLLFCMTWISMYTGYGMFWLSKWIDAYPGYELSMAGSFIGLAYAFIDGFVSLFLIAWVYNLTKP
ncbi:MAG: bacteriophage holin [Chlamydiales bacterium]|nr:bacteriophage holin [Chlamydiales bacterium]